MSKDSTSGSTPRTYTRLSRDLGRPFAPIRIVHLGLGNFFRAHTCWYTEHAVDRADWGIAAFAGRTATHVEDLRAQGEVYTVMLQSATPSVEVISALSAVHAASELAQWRRYFTRPEVALVTSTITEGGYLRTSSGDLDITAVQSDIDALRADPLGGVVLTAPGKFVAGLLARRASEGGPITFVPCDNVVGSGQMVRTVVTQMAEAVDESLVQWIGNNVGFVSTMVDRITPAASEEDLRTIREVAGYDDPAGVVAEPFAQWVLSGEFVSPHPGWESSGATIVADIVPSEHRKLWLLNGAHSLMAYLGPLRGHTTVRQAIADPMIADWVNQWWDEAARHLDLPADDITAYRSALLARFSNPAMSDSLSRIAADGSQKLPIRFGPTILAELEEARTPVAALRAIAGWVWHVRGESGPVNDVRTADVTQWGAGTLEQTVDKVLSLLQLPSSLAPDLEGIAREVRR